MLLCIGVGVEAPFSMSERGLLLVLLLGCVVVVGPQVEPVTQQQIQK